MDKTLYKIYYVLLSFSRLFDGKCQEFLPMMNHDEAVGLGVCDDHNHEEDVNNLGIVSNNQKNDYLPEFGDITDSDYDPIIRYQRRIDKFIFGFDAKSNSYRPNVPKSHDDFLTLWPTGQFMRSEMIGNMSCAHTPHRELIFRGHSTLKISEDRMQTALNAFYIFVFGSVGDIISISSSFILSSAKTISMMKISIEKKEATWRAVKGKKRTEDIDFPTLELYKPLFRYVSAEDLARLNLNDTKILSFVGTHPDLDRHQVGIIAHRYIEMNPNWMQPRYLNLMNNLLCGVPITFMSKIPMNSYLQLNHQVFYHIKACDRLQQRFFLDTMSKSQALGKPISWNAPDVARIGYLMAELTGPELLQIRPESMAGLTAQVMSQMRPEVLIMFTDLQQRYLNPKALNIFAKKVRAYEDKLLDLRSRGMLLKSHDVVTQDLCNYLVIIVCIWNF